MSETPWAQHVTKEPRPFRFMLDQYGFFCALTWPNGSFVVPSPDFTCCLGDFRITRVRFTGNQGHCFHDIEPYFFGLTELPATAEPMLRLHPFALAHLYATGQVEPTDILRAVTHPVMGGYSMPVGNCALTQMLGVDHLRLAFRTTSDFEIV